jgi:DnaJ-class molecular chaperone
VDLTFPEACLGKEVTIPNLVSGGEYKITIPPGTSPGKIFRLAGKGVPEFNSTYRGDILVKVGIKVPKNLSPEQQEFIENYKDKF